MFKGVRRFRVWLLEVEEGKKWGWDMVEWGAFKGLPKKGLLKKNLGCKQHRQDARDRRLKELTHLRRLTCLKECKGLKELTGLIEGKGDGEGKG